MPKPKTNTVELNGHVFTLPEGFTIELAAGPPLVNRPITAAFDEQDHLYVSDSSGTNDKAGSILNLIRWTSPRMIKETYVPPTDHRYPFMDAE